MSEKPLSVQVAEVLGCQPFLSLGGGWECRCKGTIHSAHTIHDDCHDLEGLGCDNALAWYETDWSATGPLVEKYKIDLWFLRSQFGNPDEWRASSYLAEHAATGPTPLIAVCNLIRTLAEGGKL